MLNGLSVGWIGALAPSVQKELSLPKCYMYEVDLDCALKGKVSKYKAFSQYQQAQRDIALVLDEATPVADLVCSIQDLKQTHFIDVALFDIYTGENIDSGKKSVALNLTYQSMEATLSDEEVNTKVEEVLALMQDKFSAVLR